MFSKKFNILMFLIVPLLGFLQPVKAEMLNCRDTIPGRNVRIEKVGVFDVMTISYPDLNKSVRFVLEGALYDTSTKLVNGKNDSHLTLHGHGVLAVNPGVEGTQSLVTNPHHAINIALVPGADSKNSAINTEITITDDSETIFPSGDKGTSKFAQKLKPGIICPNLQSYAEGRTPQ